MKDCRNCSHSAPNDTYGIPVCTKFGTPLGISPADDEATRDRISLAFAENCNSFTDQELVDTDTAMLNLKLRVGSGSDILASAVAISPKRKAPSSCSNCSFFINPSSVHRELGFEQGLCGVDATLVYPTDIISRATACSFGHLGMPRTSTDGVLLDPRYNTTAVSIKPTLPKHGSYDPTEHTKIDPREYPSDRPVSDFDRDELGIRAWRKVYYPKATKPPVYMPIFDWQKLGIESDPRETYGDHSPELYVDYTGLLYQFALFACQALSNEGEGTPMTKTLALIGEAGTGKTEFFCWVAWLMDLPFYRISLRPTSEMYEFFGSNALTVDEKSGQSVTNWKNGRFADRFSQPCVICLDEPNCAPDEIWYLLRPVLDNAGQLVIESEKVVIPRDPYCFIGMAMNPPTPGYRGTRVLSPADRRRFFAAEVSYPQSAEERLIIQAHCHKAGFEIEDNLLSAIMNISDALRSLYSDRVLTSPWGVSNNVDVALLTRGLELEDCYRAVVTVGLEQAQSEVILNQVRTYVS